MALDRRDEPALKADGEEWVLGAHEIMSERGPFTGSCLGRILSKMCSSPFLRLFGVTRQATESILEVRDGVSRPVVDLEISDGFGILAQSLSQNISILALCKIQKVCVRFSQSFDLRYCGLDIFEKLLWLLEEARASRVEWIQLRLAINVGAVQR